MHVVSVIPDKDIEDKLFIHNLFFIEKLKNILYIPHNEII